MESKKNGASSSQPKNIFSKFACVCFLVLTFCVMLSWQVNAQNNPDKLHKRDMTTLEVKVLEVTGNEIKYKKFNYLDGPTYTIQKSELKLIEYANGDKELMNEETTADSGLKEPASKHFHLYGVHVTLTHYDVWVGADYEYRWRLNANNSLADHYVGFGINFSDGLLYTSDFYASNRISFSIPLAYRIYPGKSNFFIEPYSGLRYSFYNFTYSTGVISNGAYVYDDVSAAGIGGLAGINIGFTTRSKLEFSFRLNTEQGAGFGVSYSRIYRRKK